MCRTEVPGGWDAASALAGVPGAQLAWLFSAQGPWGQATPSTWLLGESDWDVGDGVILLQSGAGVGDRSSCTKRWCTTRCVWYTGGCIPGMGGSNGYSPLGYTLGESPVPQCHRTVAPWFMEGGAQHELLLRR